MTIFEPKGPPRYAHQKRGLTKMIRTGGVAALLFDPGTGKTMTVLDFCSILALKRPEIDGVREARVLVVAPLVAVDTWVIQAEAFVSEQVNVWAEAVGGSINQRAEVLASRGGSPYKKSLLQAKNRLAPRAIGVKRAIAWYARANNRGSERPITASEGPDGLGKEKPRLILEIINLDTLSSRQQHGSGTKADLLLDAVKRFNPDLVVVDESHKIKGAQSNVSRLAARIGSVVPRRVLLTGTVMPTGPLDVFAQWRFLEPYAFGHVDIDGSRSRATYGQFKEQFAVLGGYMGREVVGYRNLDQLQRIMAKNAVVAKKEEALDLPPTQDVVVPVHLSPAEQAAYDGMKKNLVTQLAGGKEANVVNRLTQMMRLRQITSGHIPDDQGGMHEIGQSKLNVINGIANDTLIGEKRIVVFCQFTHEIHMLRDKLKSPGTVIMVASGETSTDDRMAMRKRFGSDEPTRMIMIAQIQTMSLAVNELVTANHAIFGSLSQKRDEQIQGQDRLNRIGQTRPVTFWFAIAPKTVDEVIMKSHKDRTDLESAMLDHIYQGEDL